MSEIVQQILASKAEYVASLPPTYYATSDAMTPGKVITVAANPAFDTPAFYLVHPDTLAELRRKVTARWVHLRDQQKEQG